MPGGGRFRAVLMDFGSTAPARVDVRSRAEALAAQEEAEAHCRRASTELSQLKGMESSEATVCGTSVSSKRSSLICFIYSVTVTISLLSRAVSASRRRGA